MARKAPKTPASEQLREAVRQSGMSLNALAIAAGVPVPALWRFMEDGEKHRDIYMQRTADKLIAYLGLELRPSAGRRKPS